MATVTEYASAASGTSWTSPTNANANDGAYATYTIAAKNTTGNVNTLSNLGFDSSIPANSVINSVTLEVEHKVSTNGGIAFLESAVAIGATIGTYNSDSAEPTTDTARSYSMARPGGGSWTRADLLDGTFTIKLRARSGNSATSVVYSWDYARVVVDYTPQNFTLTAQAGSYSLTGQSATVARNRALTASAGSYSLSGQSATLVKGRVLTAQAGSYSVTGQSADIDYAAVTGYTLTAQAGSYSLTGQGAGVNVGKVLTAQAGAYSFTGQGADIAIGRALFAQAGSYSITGSSAVIDYSGGGANGFFIIQNRRRR